MMKKHRIEGRRAPRASVETTSPARHFFGSCPTGLEEVLLDELMALGAQRPHATRGGVSFEGTPELCYRINLESRIASRVLWRVFRGPYRNERDVQETAHGLSWPDWFEAACTIKVKVSARSCPLKSLDFVTLKIKDGICDRFRALTGRRPSVETRGPDVRIEAFLDAAQLSLYLDTSGEALFKRGYRTGPVEAPLRENLAAGLVRLAGWTPDRPLLDPLCGGGTILIEAAHLAWRVAPGLGRTFAFEKLSWFDPKLWGRQVETSRAAQRQDVPLRIYGSDQDGNAVARARENMAAAGLTDAIQLEQADVLDLAPPAPEGILISNPPYGVRVGDQETLADFYGRFGSVLKQRFPGWRVYLLTANLRLPSLLRLAASRRIPLFNGPLECRLMEFRMVVGSMRRRAPSRPA